MKNSNCYVPLMKSFGTYGWAISSRNAIDLAEGWKVELASGGDKMRAGIFKVIKNGKKRPDGTISMTGWKETLSNEQTWGLVYFIEKGL